VNCRIRIWTSNLLEWIKDFLDHLFTSV